MDRYRISLSVVPVNGSHMENTSEKVKITFDDEGRVRVLDAEKFKATEGVQKESVAFVSSTLSARSIVQLEPLTAIAL